MAGPGGKEVGRLSLKVLPDTSEFSGKLKAFAERVEKTTKIEIPVDIDGKRAKIQMLGIIYQAKVMAAAANPTIHVDVDMKKTAVATAATTQAARGLSSSFDSANTNANLLARSVLVMLPLVLTVASVAATIAPAFAAVIPLGFGIIGVVGAIALGWKQLKAVMKPVIDGFKEMRKPIGKVLSAGLTGPFEKFAKGTLPIIQVGMQKFARLVNKSIADVLRFFNTGKGGKLLAQSFEAVRDAMRPFSKLAQPLVEMFLQLSIAAAPALQMMGRGILNAVRNFNKFLATGKASGAITSAMRTLGTAIQGIGRFIAAIFPDLVAMFPAVSAAFSGIASVLVPVFKVLGKVGAFAGKYPGIFSAVAAAVTGGALAFGVLSAAMLVFNAVVSANPIVRLVTILFAVGAAIAYAYKNSATFRSILQTIGSALVTAFNAVVGVIKTVVNFIVSNWKTIGLILIAPFIPLIAFVILVVNLIRTHWGSIVAFITTVWNVIKVVIMTAITVISTIIRVQLMVWKTIFTVVWAVIKTVVQVAIRVIATVIRAGIAVIKGVIAGVKVIVSIFRAAFNAARAVVSAVINAIRSVVRGGIATVLAVIRGVKAVAGLFRSAFNAAKSAVSSVVGNILSFIRGIPGKIKGFLTFDLSGAGRKIMTSFGNGILAAGRAAYNKVKDIASKIKGLLPGSPIKWGPLKSWNRGGAGIRLMNLLAAGIRARQGHVLAQVRTTAARMDNAWSVPSLADGFLAAADMNRMRTSLSASVGAIVDNTTSPGAQEIIIANWQTGRGTMAEIADEKLAAVEFVNQQNDRMGVPK